MQPSGSDPNPWYFGNEMTFDGCRGLRPSDAASSANGSTNNPGTPPASDGQAPPEKPNANATPGPDRHPSTQNHNCTPRTPQEHRDESKCLGEDAFDKSSYVFSNGRHSQMAVPASSHEYQMSGLDHMIPGKDIPRSMDNQQYRTKLEAWCFSICNASSEMKTQGYTLMTPVPSGPNEAISGPPGPVDQKGPEVPRKNIKKQDALVTKNQDAENRQLDIGSDTEEDADTDENSSEEPRWAGKHRREY